MDLLGLNHWLLLRSDVTVYVVIFALLLTGALGFPPEDFTLLLAGITHHQGKGELDILFALCYVGTVLGDLFIYAVGRWFGPSLFRKAWFKKRVRPGRIKLTRIGLERRSFTMIFVARHLFYLRTVTFITCGAVKMKFHRFLIADCLSALVSVPLMLFLGFKASANFDAIINLLHNAKLVSLLLIVTGLFAVFFMFFKQRREAEEQAVDDTPATEAFEEAERQCETADERRD